MNLLFVSVISGGLIATLVLIATRGPRGSIRFIARRLLSAIPTLFAIITIAFFMMHAAPGGPFSTDRPVPPEIEANLNQLYRIDQPLIVQYWTYLTQILQGDFGPSLKNTDLTVTELIWDGFPASMQLGLAAILLAALIGSGLGALAALRQNRPSDHIATAIAMTGIIIPTFVMAPLLTLVVGVYLRLLPPSGWGNGHELKYKVLPVVALALPQIGYIARLTRGSLIEVLSSEFIRTARAKGLSEWHVVSRHAARAALLPIVSYLGPAAAGIITGSVVIETIFAIPGVGRYFVLAAVNRDYTLVMGMVIFYGVLIILFNLLVDVLYGVLNPRLALR